MTGLKILEVLNRRIGKKHRRPQMTATAVAKFLKVSSSTSSARLVQLMDKGLVERTEIFNPTSGKTPWIYIITPKGKKYLSLKKQLKALLTHE